MHVSTLSWETISSKETCHQVQLRRLADTAGLDLASTQAQMLFYISVCITGSGSVPVELPAALVSV